MADVDDYLQEGFDARSVTVPRLRSILVTHNVDYPSTAKKPQLVELVNDHVLSQASKLRAQRAKAKRSSLGFINAGSADDSNTWEDHDTKSRQSSARRSMSPRKSSGRAKAEREERIRSSRSASRQLGQLDEEDGSVASKTSRRSRRTVTPQIKAESDIEEEDNSVIHHEVSDHDEEDEDEDEEEVGDESVFTDDNPFQSGSSPPPVVTPGSRRRTLGEVVAENPKSARRKTDNPIAKSKKPRSSDVSSRRARTKTPEFALDPSEEFTAEAQLELEESHAAGEGAVVRRKNTTPSRQSSVLTPLFVLFMALLGAYGAWYRQEKIAVGYCGLGRPAQQLLPPDIDLPDTLVPLIEPQCEQCPQNAYCYEGFTARCVSGFILKPHPLSLGGLIPLPPTCEPDSEQERRVQAVADKAVEELRERRAKYECGDLVDETGHQEDSPAIAEEELKEAVSKKRNKRLSDEEFDELWDKAIGKVTTRDEVEVQEETSTTTEASDSPSVSNRKLSSSSLARLPFTCAIRRSIRLGLARNRFAIGLLISLALGVLYVRARYHRHVTTSAQVPALVDLVLGRLASQKELGEEELDDPWLFLPNLRDDVLRSVHSLSERERIWQRVRAVVEQNSNVRTGQRESRSGEVGRAWEWIGPVGGESARRRRSGRVSWIPDVKEETPDGNRAAEMKKWEESRPIY